MRQIPQTELFDVLNAQRNLLFRTGDQPRPAVKATGELFGESVNVRITDAQGQGLLHPGLNGRETAEPRQFLLRVAGPQLTELRSRGQERLLDFPHARVRLCGRHDGVVECVHLILLG